MSVLRNRTTSSFNSSIEDSSSSSISNVSSSFSKAPDSLTVLSGLLRKIGTLEISIHAAIQELPNPGNEESLVESTNKRIRVQLGELRGRIDELRALSDLLCPGSSVGLHSYYAAPPDSIPQPLSDPTKPLSRSAELSQARHPLSTGVAVFSALKNGFFGGGGSIHSASGNHEDCVAMDAAVAKGNRGHGNNDDSNDDDFLEESKAAIRADIKKHMNEVINLEQEMRRANAAYRRSRPEYVRSLLFAPRPSNPADRASIPYDIGLLTSDSIHITSPSIAKKIISKEDRDLAASVRLSESLASLKATMLGELDKSSNTNMLLDKTGHQIDTGLRGGMNEMGSHVTRSDYLLTKMFRRRRTDKLLIFLGCLFLAATVFYIVFKRVGFHVLYAWIPGLWILPGL